MFNFLKRSFQLFCIGSAAKKVRISQTETEKLLAQRALVALLADAKGISMKVGQLFATVDGNSEFQSLTNRVPAIPLKIMLPILEKSLGCSPKKVFKNIQPAVAAASLGQVHLAELLDGTPVAIKIRYPNIADAVNVELQLANLMPSVGKVEEWGFDLNSYKKMLFDTLQRELDYRGEASRQIAFKKNLNISNLNIPSVYEALSSECILVQSRATGVTFPEIMDWSETERLMIAETLLQTLLKSVFVTGEIHADPHNGNTFFNHASEGEMVTLLDFGCTVSLDKTRRLALLKLIVGCREKTDVNPLDCFVALGFEAKKLAHIHGALPHLSQLMFAPFLTNHVFNLAEWQLETKITQLLAENRWWFRSAGAADILLLMRAFQGLVHQLQQLNINLNWWEFLKKSIDEKLFVEARSLNLPSITIENPSFKKLDFASQAKLLHVNVTKNNQPLVRVSLPAEAAFDLESIIPETVRIELDESKTIDLKKLVQSLKLEGLSPQILFEYGIEEKHYRVWLA